MKKVKGFLIVNIIITVFLLIMLSNYMVKFKSLERQVNSLSNENIGIIHGLMSISIIQKKQDTINSQQLNINQLLSVKSTKKKEEHYTLKWIGGRLEK
jgi:hypothetical protein